MIDARQTLLKEGRLVAYNLSGNVAMGTLVHVPEDTRPYKRKIKVQLLHNAAGLHAGHVSTVNDERNLIVILPGDAPHA